MEHSFVLPNSGHNRDDVSSKMGMWLFLFTEVLLFGGLFLVYLIYRYIYHAEFLHAHYELDVVVGTINTIVLLVSSMTIAMSITATQKGNKDLAIALLYVTIGMALIFMVNKYFEWTAKFEHGLFPGMEHFNHLDHGEKLFYFLYFFMTGLHALHVIVGAIFIGFVIKAIQENKVNSKQYMLHENAGLYWHLVDLIWIYLFPLFYLIS
jgi:cytochrome c oxidase subunit 3